MYKEVKGDLIELALADSFEVIAHGCNCFCVQKSGLAPQMVRAFSTDKFLMEQPHRVGDITKLGNIDYQDRDGLFVVNCYTQFSYDVSIKPLDYEALTLCLRKMNIVFKHAHIGLPMIGCHLAGGDWNRVKEIIKTELKDCEVTIVIYNK